MEHTLIILKPDTLKRKLAGEIITRFERKGFEIKKIKMLVPNEEQVKQHYAEHVGKPFFQELLEYFTSGPVIVMIIEGINAVGIARKMLGATRAINAEPGTIRGDYAYLETENLVHASDSVESVIRESKIWFEEEN
ncbi:MAG: nucleoside-diphosphate kinase [Armatimonadetes bacterium]|nr:nucleoside-diphosphate kinase [Candidatus Hippobium faecium]